MFPAVITPVFAGADGFGVLVITEPVTADYRNAYIPGLAKGVFYK